MDTVDVPWFISLEDGELDSFNISDSLKKYRDINPNNLINKAQFLSYRSNLNAFGKDSINSRKFIAQSFKTDSIAICKNLILPINNYLIEDRPDREKSIPPILDYNLDYIIDLIDLCDCRIPKRMDIRSENKRNFYWLKYIILRDQWYRVPERKENWQSQTRLDIENQKLLDRLFPKKKYPKDQFFKEVLQVLLLHSSEPEWTGNWLKTYLEIFKGDSQTLPFLSHFMQRSYVSDDLNIIKIVESYKKSNFEE